MRQINMSKKKETPKITKEIMQKVIYLDCSEEEGLRRLNKSLMKLPMVKTEDDLETDRLEEMVKKLELRYMVHLGYVMRTVVDGKDVYTGMIKTDVTVRGEWLETVYGKTFNEILKKTLFYMYYFITTRKVKASLK